MKKRIFSLILAVYLTASLLAVPAGAAGTAPFSDVTDSEMAADVECLRLLGVLDGYADGSFRPNATLTRAQFCKMAVYAMNASAELGKYRAVTVFPDVKPGHWASSYINLASKGKGIILGFADGQFHPEATVTAGQAVTILMRLLDYKDEDVGAVWPDGYLAQAAVIGLTNGLSLSGGAALNRGQAARLFVNLLRCEKKDETSYAASIAASIVEHTMLVSSSASAGDGTDTGMQVGNGSTYRMANKTSGGLLNGRMGTLLLNKDGKVMTFVRRRGQHPDDSGGQGRAEASHRHPGRDLRHGERYRHLLQRRGEHLGAGLFLADRGHLRDAVSGRLRRRGIRLRRRHGRGSGHRGL